MDRAAPIPPMPLPHLRPTMPHTPTTPIPDLAATLALLQRHHRATSALSRGPAPCTAEWHSLWPSMRTIREHAEAGEVECRDWLALNAGLIAAVEAVRRHGDAERPMARGYLPKPPTRPHAAR